MAYIIRLFSVCVVFVCLMVDATLLAAQSYENLAHENVEVSTALPLPQATEPAVLTPAAPPTVYLPPPYGAEFTPLLMEPWTDPAIIATAAEAPLPPSSAPIASLTPLELLDQKVNGLLQSATGTSYPNVKISGVFQVDAGWINQDGASVAEYGRIRNGVDFRRARLAASGGITEVNNYFFQMDFAFFGRPTFTDLWIDQTDLPFLGNVRVGQWKQPFSLEVVSSFRYTTFVERSALFQAFTPFRHVGIGFYDHNRALTSTWAASVFAAGNDQYGGSISTAGGVGASERITWLPRYDEPSGGRYYLHLGAGHYFSSPNDHVADFRTIPEMYIGQFLAAVPVGSVHQQPTPTLTTGIPFFVATGPLRVQNFNVLGTELLWVRGAFSLQAEAMVNFVNRLDGEDLILSGAYAQVGYFLTGEHRPYDRKAGAIDRIKPFENFFRVRSKTDGMCRGWGAWELAQRISTLNLNDHDVRGGILTDFTTGLNWYLNPNTKCQFNYIHSHTTNAAAAVALTNLFDLRVQVDF